MERRASFLGSSRQFRRSSVGMAFLVLLVQLYMEAGTAWIFRHSIERLWRMRYRIDFPTRQWGYRNLDEFLTCLDSFDFVDYGTYRGQLAVRLTERTHFLVYYGPYGGGSLVGQHAASQP